MCLKNQQNVIFFQKSKAIAQCAMKWKRKTLLAAAKMCLWVFKKKRFLVLSRALEWGEDWQFTPLCGQFGQMDVRDDDQAQGLYVCLLFSLQIKSPEPFCAVKKNLIAKAEPKRFDFDSSRLKANLRARIFLIKRCIGCKVFNHATESIFCVRIQRMQCTQIL